MDSQLTVSHASNQANQKARIWGMIAISLVILTVGVSIFGGEEILEIQDILLVPLIGIAMQRWKHWSDAVKVTSSAQ